MSTKIFVGNFSFSIDDQKLKEYFEKAGTVVSAKVMTEGQGGRSRGFGFVEMGSPAEAEKAIKELDGGVWEGRVVKVCEDRSARGGGGHSSSSDDSSHSRRDRDSHGDNDRAPSAPMGYFRAQPLDIGTKQRRKSDPFLEDEALFVDYKDPKILQRFMSERGRILPRRMTGLTTQNQRLVKRAIKRAQHLALLPYTRG